MYTPGTPCLIIQAPPQIPDLLHTTVVVGSTVGPHDCKNGPGCWIENRIMQSLEQAQHEALQRAIEVYGPEGCAYPIAFMRPIGPPKDPDRFSEQPNDDGLVHHRVRYPLTTETFEEKR